MSDKTGNTWTIMIYMAGDNNLSADMAYALEQISEIVNVKENSEKINLMVYYDSCAIGAPTLYCDFSDLANPIYKPAYLVEKGFEYKKRPDGDPESAAQINENSATIYSILNFVNWCVNDTKDVDADVDSDINLGRRADKYALIFSGHSSAFQNISFLVDESSDYYMTIPKMSWALEQITRTEQFKENPLLLKQNIDVLGFDSCVMGMLELGYEFSKYAKTMVASEGNIPSAGWTYGKILTDLVCKNENLDEKQVAQRFVTRFINRQNKYAIGGVSVDMAAWNLSVVGELVSATDNLGKKLNEILDNEETEQTISLKKILLNCHWSCQSYLFEQNVDLKDFCQMLYAEIAECDADDKNGLLKLCELVIEQIDKCILICGFSGGRYQYSNGISIYFPWTALSYYGSLKTYENLNAFTKTADRDERRNQPDEFYENKLDNWKAFLENFLIIQTMRPARPEFVSDTADIAGNGNNILATVYYPAEKNSHLANDKSGFWTNDKNSHTANDKNNHLANDKNNHLANDKNIHTANDKNNLFANDKNSHIANDKNNHLVNDRNNHLANDKGLALLMLTQFKNVETPWYISGFTKDIEKDKKYEKEIEVPQNG